MSDSLEQDFAREAYALFGLPIDRCSSEELISRFLTSPELGPTVIITPNLQIARESHHDRGFRENLLQANLLLPDGMPLVWAARLLGLPFRDRTTGSGTIQKLFQVAPPNGLRVKIFGGTGGTCERAVKRISEYSGVQIVEWFEPPLGSVEDLSRPDRIKSISSEACDLFLTSLTASKAIAWLHRNKDHLRSRFFMEFGAGLKFLAGNVRRAPRWMQQTGLEWFWRLLQEPGLAERYLRDGVFFLSALTTRILPLATWRWLHQYLPSRHGKVRFESGTIHLEGSFPDGQESKPLLDALTGAARHPQDTIIDLNQVDFLGCRAVALMMLCRKHKLVNETRLLLRADAWRPRLLMRLHGALLLTD
jgi:N-acetylglucosaminyldiphosphoundecaprenol N-acetyl-beta-D-mannosaminyltransferase